MLSRSMKRTGANEFSNGSIEIQEWAVMRGEEYSYITEKNLLTLC